MHYNYLLNKIKLKDGKEVSGIIDFRTSKQLYFFDFDKQNEIEYLLLAMMWKGNSDQLRFSVYCAMEYPTLSLPKAILIPFSNIESIVGDIPDFTKAKQRKKIIKVAAS